MDFYCHQEKPSQDIQIPRQPLPFPRPLFQLVCLLTIFSWVFLREINFQFTTLFNLDEFFSREINYLFVYLIFPAAVIGRRRNYPSSASSHQQLNQPSHYKRFHDYASFSSFSDTSSHHIVRRPSVDTISTYLSSQYRYGGSSRTASSYYAGGSFGGSQDLIDMYGHETDSVFTDEEDHISFQSRRYAFHEFNYVNLFRVFFL